MFKPRRLSRLLFVAGLFLTSFGCAHPPPPATVEEAPPPPPQTNPVPEVLSITRTPPQPKPLEVRNAVTRVFRDIVTIESQREPHFIAGDFNGDLSQDLAVIVRPKPGRLAEMNDEFANWIVVDPARITRQRARVGEEDVLLAVIHGFGTSGWRHSQATQTYVLRSVSESPMRARLHKQVVRADNSDKLPRIWGDVIDQTINGHSGFLYYEGSKYAWYDPRTYKPSLPARIVHGRPAEALRK
jgi:hypothetical protein